MFNLTQNFEQSRVIRGYSTKTVIDPVSNACNPKASGNTETGGRMSKIFIAFQARQQTIRRIVAKYRPNPADIDEITQETFLKGFAAELDTEIHEPEHFLMRVAKNLAINHAQKKVNSTGLSVEDIGGVSVLIDENHVSQEDRLDARQRLFILSQGLACLPSELKDAFIMRRIDGLKYKQIATRLNVSVSTVEKRVASAMIDIHIYLREQGYNPVEFGAAPQSVSRTSITVAPLREALKSDKDNK